MNMRKFALILACLALTPHALAQKVPRSVTPETLEKYWVLMKSSVEGNAPLGGRNMDQPGCASVSFIVEKNGRTSDITVEKVEPPGGLGELAASITSNLQFEPTIRNAARDRVFSSMIFPFNLPEDPEARTAIMQRCVIPARAWKPKSEKKQ
ncbi:energy transducer TonB [Dokdonella sp.]|uniref:energy transducer TonB n=1 Tax=Dokdonella sp. TaxID=2291710 RepID=UPI0035288190